MKRPTLAQLSAWIFAFTIGVNVVIAVVNLSLFVFFGQRTVATTLAIATNSAVLWAIATSRRLVQRRLDLYDAEVRSAVAQAGIAEAMYRGVVSSHVRHMDDVSGRTM